MADPTSTLIEDIRKTLVAMQVRLRRTLRRLDDDTGETGLSCANPRSLDCLGGIKPSPSRNRTTRE